MAESSSTQRNQALHALFEEDWTWELQDNPEFASFAGFHDIVHPAGAELQSLSDESYKNRAAHSSAMLEKLVSIRAAGELTGHDATFASLFQSMHEDMKDSIERFPLYMLPINSIGAGCPQRSFMETIEWMRFETVEDYRLYGRKLAAFPRQMNEMIECMREGIRQGYVASQAMVKDVEEQMKTIIDGDLSEFTAPLTSEVGAALAGEHEALFVELRTLIAATRDAYTAFLAFFTSEYQPAARPEPGCNTLPNGEALYNQCLKYHTTTNLTAEEIHAVGLAEVAKIEARFRDDVLTPLGFDPADFPAFVAHANADPRFYLSDGPALLQHYRHLCAAIQQRLPELFAEFPASPLEIVSKEDGGPAAYYLAGTPDGKRPGRFYVNVSHIEKRPTYEAVALALHEAVPGHHHQISLATENEALPNFLRFLEDRRYEVAPCRRNMYTGYIEGWGLYSELLGEELGLYATPYDLFGRLSMDMMRAVRLVVDTGLHSQGWSVDRAIEYMQSKTGMHRHEVEAEVYRYASWPGQACAYKVGQLEIVRLRRLAESELGANFDVRAFHTVCLGSGSLPLSLLEVKVLEYISSVKGVSGDAPPQPPAAAASS